MIGPLTPMEEALAMAAENRARQRAMTDKQRKEAGEGTIKLMKAADDAALFSMEFQVEFRGLLDQFRKAGVKVDASLRSDVP